VEAGERTFAPAAIDLAEQARETLRLYAFSLEQHGLAVETAWDPAAPHVWADPESVQEALHNLVDNALKYGAEGAALRVRVAPEARSGRAGAFVEVADRGPGVPESARARIFEKFFRVGDGDAGVALTTRAKGTGLGLALVRHIAEAQGGTATLAPTDPHDAEAPGACFRLWLPAAPEETGKGRTKEGMTRT
jgi:signal transduction histidine kinase